MEEERWGEEEREEENCVTDEEGTGIGVTGGSEREGEGEGEGGGGEEVTWGDAAEGGGEGEQWHHQGNHAGMRGVTSPGSSLTDIIRVLKERLWV